VGSSPDFETTVPLMEVLLYGVLNPATIVVAFMMGQRASDKTKLIIASFAGAVAGAALLFIATFLRLWDAPTLGRSIAGVFIVSLVAGFVYAGAGYLLKRKAD
jgi:hypothetical protein